MFASYFYLLFKLDIKAGVYDKYIQNNKFSGRSVLHFIGFRGDAVQVYVG